MTARNEDFLFAQEAQNLGYVTEEQVEEGFLLQRRMADDLQIDERLAVILVKRGWMADEQARRVYGIIEPEGARSRIEGYRLVEKIGRGAMGTVYKAIHKGLHRVVAIKILRRDLATDKTQIERLKREAQLLADLDHPNIVRAFDAGESNGFPYFVMEYVEGDTLRDMIATKGTLANEEALRITRALADALEKARRMGVVHRDVKPGNILMSKSGTPKLMDLGLAKGPLDPGLTQHGATVGTPQFMSPEQAESPDKADTRSDIYSLGATLYAMVTGRPPFEGSTLAEIITKVMSQQPAPPRVRNPDVSPEVSHLIERMMLKDASLRYDTPAEVIADIDMIRGGRSIIPRGFQGNWEAFLLRKRFLQWRRRIVIGLAAALVLTVGGLIWWKQNEKEGARAGVADLETELLALPPLSAGDTLEDLKLRLAAMEQKAAQIREVGGPHGVVGENRLVIDRRIRELGDAVHRLTRYLAVKEQILAHLGARRYRAAEDTGQTREFDDFLLAHDRLKDLRKRVRTESDAALSEAVAAVLDDSTTTLPSFVKKWNDHARVYAGNWVQTSAWKRGGDRARTAAEKATAIGAVVSEFDAKYTRAAVKQRVQDLDFYGLKRDVRADRERTASKVGAHLRAWPAVLPAPRLLVENGLASLALAQPEARIDEAVLDYWERLQETVRQDPSKANLERIARFEDKVDLGGYYPTLVGEAARLRLELVKQYRARQEQSIALYDLARKGVLAALRNGRPADIETRIDDALGQTGRLSPAMRESLEGLRIGAAVLSAVQDAALAWLAEDAQDGKGQLHKDVRVRSAGGRLIPPFRVVAVDKSTRTFTARMSRKGSGRRKEDISIGIGEVVLSRVLAWAEQSGATLPPSAPVFAALAVLPPVADDPGSDLRADRGAYQRVAQQFDAPELAAWRAFATELGAGLDALQEAREERAGLALAEADTYFDRGKYNVALPLYEDLADEGGRLRYTARFRKARSHLAKRLAKCRNILAQQEMLRLFYGGVDVIETSGGRHIVTFDFDDLGQLENFERGFARARTTRRTVTPDERARARELLLLPGVRGIVRDRPLSLLTLFDPNELIVLEVRINTLRGSSILAFDIDGVQLAICSADPNWWKRRFPEDVPLLHDEEQLPAFDFYGMGRGIAFHEGRDFGRSFPHGNWDWSARSAGRNFERWKDSGYLEKQREHLFALEPARTYTVRIERLRGQLSLFVDDQLVLKRSKASWAQKGATSESNPKIRNGSGRIQILTWTPLVIDDLRLEGKISAGWQERRRREMKK